MIASGFSIAFYQMQCLYDPHLDFVTACRHSLLGLQVQKQNKTNKPRKLLVPKAPSCLYIFMFVTLFCLMLF